MRRGISESNWIGLVVDLTGWVSAKAGGGGGGGIPTSASISSSSSSSSAPPTDRQADCSQRQVKSNRVKVPVHASTVAWHRMRPEA